MRDRSEDSQVVVPVVEEQVRVEARERVTGRVRVSTEIHSRTEHLELDLLRQDVQILRVPVNRPVDAVPDVRKEGEVTIYPVVEEVVTVTRQLVLKEELRISRHSTTERHAEDVVLRRAEAVVERLPPER